MGGMLSYLMSWAAPTKTYDPTPDPVTGLTEKDKELITYTWSLAANKKTVKENGVEFFIQLFEAHPYMQDYFKLFKGKPLAELRTSPKMRAHATSVMYAMTSYVEMLDDSETLVGLIQKLATSHVQRGITTEDFQKLQKVFLRFVKSLLGSQCTPDIESAYDKLLTAHNAVYKSIEDEMKKANGKA